MRVKTSITLARDTLRAMDRAAGKRANRSRLIEAAINEFLARRMRASRDARDLDILNRAADQLNDEMHDVLAYQAKI